jgi:hypothetical protein
VDLLNEDVNNGFGVALKIRKCSRPAYLWGFMVQDLHFSVKKAHFWLVPILVLAGLFSWTNGQDGRQSQAQPVKTEVVVSASKGKAASRLCFTTVKRFTPTITTPSDVFTAKTVHVLRVCQAATYSRIKSTISFAAWSYWKTRSLPYISVG